MSSHPSFPPLRDHAPAAPYQAGDSSSFRSPGTPLPPPRRNLPTTATIDGISPLPSFHPPASALPHDSQDESIRGTNDDAVISRASAVEMGYLSDPFIKWFVRRGAKRPPIINRGTYSRVRALDDLTAKFLKTNPESKQVVSLGAGSDTRYFLLKAGGVSARNYFEIDFGENTVKKVGVLRKKKEMLELLEDYKLAMGGMEIHAKGYHLIAGDLRKWETEVVAKLESHGFDKRLPTLFLSECVMIYMLPQDSDALVRWVATHMDNAMYVTYEQILPDDAFGRVMLHNLKMRGIELPGIHSYPTIEDQKERYLKHGFDQAHALDMNQIWDHHTDPQEHLRIMKLEIFDEVEEWRLLSAHYCVSWAFKSSLDMQDPLSPFHGVQFTAYEPIRPVLPIKSGSS
ncbi:S-adenosyl-L-methionine-dependent methyltransferase [Polychytrium aggregatum]|uniref:S-adenosyl-L-methionine-dependent methyltransferase n=1 Tax=Polychytrium aggregatum TaxID=110093 RepID=UPI0022FE53F3|nr:S-adenosyl-L-methionine-dependent methyltransferase [Polychytrium aggregatum]KAI9205854.1 S-adenosyl-L-methionine-dependent methyltransferase [Polychytrium aggregatum]